MPADPESILKRRAETLARPVDDDRQVRTVELLVLTLPGDRRYGVESRYVRRIAVNLNLSRLPAGCGEFIGVLPVGGQVVPAVDLASMLQLATVDPKRPFVVAVQRGRDLVGLLVDGVQEVVEVPEHHLTPVPDADRGPSLARRMTADGLAVLDLDSFFGDGRLLVTPARSQPPYDQQRAQH